MLVIFSKLMIQAEDREWIESIRRAHDPQHAIVAPHFTFVFPFTGIAVEDALAHARNVAEATPRLAFRLCQATAVDDPLSSGSHVFLLPSDGSHEMRALHARLYSGILAPKLNPAVPFLPHVTVGAFERRDSADRVVASLPSFDIRGTLDAILLAEFDGRTVTDLHRLGLQMTRASDLHPKGHLAECPGLPRRKKPGSPPARG